MVPIPELIASLRRLGVTGGDTVMVHASMRRLGPVEGGAAGLVRALDEAVGPDGTLLMTVGARDDCSWVNERPESERPALLAGTLPFDYRLATADPDVGVLAEIFRQMPGTHASDHPEGRFAARGRHAEELLRDVPWNDYYGPGSPLHRLVAASGKVLRVGADVETVTLIHYAEYLADVPDKRRVRRHRLVAGAGGPAVRAIECLDDEHGIVEYSGDYFGDILTDYLRIAAPGVGLVGRAHSELLDAAGLVTFAARWMTERFTPQSPHGA